MITFSSKITAHIRFLLQSLNDSNSDSIFQELCKFTVHGMDGSIMLLQTCLDHANIYDKDLKNMKLHPLYASIFKQILEKPNFSTVFSASLKTSAINEEFLQNLTVVLHLSVPEKIAIALALSDSENHDVRMCGKKFCMGQISELCASSMILESTDLIQQILMFLTHSEDLSKHVDSFMQMLYLVQLNEGAQFNLAPFLPDEVREDSFFRHLDLLNDGGEDDFEAILAEMEKDISMAGVMSELGYECTVNVSQCQEMLSLFSPLSEVTVAKILGTLARTYTGLDGNQNLFATFCSAFGSNSAQDPPSLNSWNIDVLVDSIKQLAPDINWIKVMEKLDHEGFYIPNESAFSFLMSAYKYACKDPFPLHAICGFVWKNVEGQLSFLKYAVSVPPEIFTFAHSERQLIHDDAVSGHTFHCGKNQAWSCHDLLEVLCQLAERGHASSVRSVLENPLKHCPEVLLLGMAHVKTPYNLIQYEVSSAVLPIVLKNASGSSLMRSIWHANANMLLCGVTDAMNFDIDDIYRILDACQELKILSPMLDMVPSYFGVRLAALASKRKILDLENWLSTNLVAYGDAFHEECLKFLKEVHIGAQDLSSNRFRSPGSVNAYSEACPTFLKVLQSHAGLVFSAHLPEEMEKLNVTYTRGIVTGDGSDSTSSDSHVDNIDAELNSYFHQMFSGQLAIDATIQMLVRLKESSAEREQSMFKCTMSYIFNESEYFFKYPERELKIAAVFWGSIVKHRLVNHIELGAALRRVLDALRKPADSKMFVFGNVALKKFMDRLVEWPLYCNHILQISHLRTTDAELVAFIERILARNSAAHAEPDVGHNSDPDHNHGPIKSSTANMEISGSSFSLTGLGSSQSGPQISSPSQLPHRHVNSLDERKTSANLSGCLKPSQSSAGQQVTAPSSDTSTMQKPHNAVGLTSLHSSSPGFARASRGFGSALNIETLVAAAERRETHIEVPGSEIQDKISFIINNLSATNVEAKSKEFTEILKEQYYSWFAEYIVMKRASIEPNFHDLYIKFLDKVTLKPLYKEVVQATYENCKVLLGSELIRTSVEERSLLKNLGSWLGKITIGRNQVLRAREIDPKSLIIEAYEKGLMIAVIPFTSKILESCSNSLVYQPPNPWTMAILGLLAEICEMENLKMNLKFDIEVLFKNLRVELREVRSTSLLADKVPVLEGNPDLSIKDTNSLQPPTVNEVKPGIISTRNQVDRHLDVVPPHAGGNPRIMTKYAISPHVSPAMLTDEEKLVSLGISYQLPSQGFLPVQSPISVNQLPVPATNIEQQVVVSKKLQAFGLHMNFQSVLPIAMNRAVKEIVSSIVLHSVSIAIKTTRELVSKDYAIEPDETVKRNAAHLMVARLAGSLAHVTCKDPLRGSISSQLRSLLHGANANISSELLEQAIQLVTNDNLDLGCRIIEQAAAQKAVQTIDGEIMQQPSIGRQHRESVSSTFFEASLYTQGQIGILPEALRSKPGQLSHSQQQVYEDFARFPGQNHSSQNSNAVPLGSSASSGSGGLSKQFGSASGIVDSGIYSSGLLNAGIGALTPEISSSEMDTNRPQIPSGSATNIADGEGVRVQILENVTVTSIPPSSTPELQFVKPSSSLKESRTAQPPINATISDERHGSNGLEPLLTTGDALDKYQAISEKLENLLAGDAKDDDIQGVIAEVPKVILKCINRDEAALAVAQKVFKGLYETASNIARIDAHLAILAAIRDVSKLVVKELTSWVIYSEEDRKFNKDIIIGLIRCDLLNLAEYNVYMAKLLDAGRNKAATEFSIALIQALGMNDPKVISELHNLVDALPKLAARPGSPESLQHVVELAKNPATTVAAMSAVTGGKEDNLRISRDKKATGPSGISKEDYTPTNSVSELAGFHEKQVSVLFAEWYQICELPGANDSACAHYVLQLGQRGLLRGDEISDRFFRQILELSVTHCLNLKAMKSTSSPSYEGQQLSFLAIDIYAKLVFSILKFYNVGQGSVKLSLFPKVLAVTVKFIQKDAEEKKTSFNPRPYFRLFVNWLLDLCSLDPVFDGANFQVLIALANSFHAIQPLKIPGFSFAWLQLVSHPSFMPKLLTANAQKGWPYLERLLVDLFQFMEPFLRNDGFGEPVQLLYKGTLRVLLVLLHDFPEFLCDYHFSFCDVIPPSCIQMRNIILSAFPRNMRLPDPSTPNLKIDLLPECSQAPRILSEVDAALKTNQIKRDVDEYLKRQTRPQESSFLTELNQKLLLSSTDAARAGTRYNVPLINSLVLYVGMQSVQQLQARAPSHSQFMGSMTAFLESAGSDIFQTLITDLDTEGRYLFLSAVANQLRYPNNHTHYFSFILLYLFAESNQELIQEQITRVLFERLIVHRPHPWGLLITFTELVKNPRYNFWSRSFTRCAPEIEGLLESISRSCGGSKPVDESVVSGEISDTMH